MANQFDTPVLLDAQNTYFGFGRANGASRRLDYDTEVNGGFTVGNTIFGSLSGARGEVVSVKDNGAALTGSLYLSNVTGSFQANDVLTDTLARGTATGADTAYDGATATHMQILYWEGDPSNVLQAPQGSLCMCAPTATLYVNTDGGVNWTPV